MDGIKAPQSNKSWSALWVFIFRGRISTTGSVKLAVFISIYALTFVFLYVYAQSAFDPRDVMFIYDSPAAMGLIGLRCVGQLTSSQATQWNSI